VPEREDDRMNAPLKLADRVAAKAAEAQARMDRDRNAEAKHIRRLAKKGKPKHGSEGRFELGVRDIHDPWQPGEVQRVAVNRRENPLEMMYRRRTISKLEYACGLQFGALCEQAGVTGVSGIDYSGANVQVPPGPRAIADAAIRASHQLRRIERHLGTTGFRLLVQIVALGTPIRQMASRLYGEPKTAATRKRQDQALGFRIREALRDLARLLGHYRRRKPRAEHLLSDEYAAEANEWNPPPPPVEGMSDE
jgi:hypothetical protein